MHREWDKSRFEKKNMAKTNNDSVETSKVIQVPKNVGVIDNGLYPRGAVRSVLNLGAAAGCSW